MKIYRDFSIERDESGMPTKMYWRGDYAIPPAPTKAEREQAKLKEWEALYGKRER